MNRDSLFIMEAATLRPPSGAVPAGRSRRDERRAANRDAIVAGTLSLVAEGGYAAASMQDVARRAGVATGSLYRHFPSKGELLARVFTEAADRELALVRHIAEDRSRPAIERLAAALEAFARRALAAPQLAYALMAEPVDPAVEAARLANKRAHQEVFAALLEQAVSAGEIPALDAPLAAAAIIGAFQEALIGPLAGALTSRRRAGRAADSLVAGLVTFTLNAVGGRHGHHPA
jgi:AcrR family transcriptional regulator